MASSTSSGGIRGRRKQAKPQRKQVDVDLLLSANTEQFATTLTEIAATASSMSPDTNSNEASETPEEIRRRMNGLHKQGAVPEEVLNNNGLSLHSLHRIVKTGGTADDVLNDSTSAKAAVGEPSEIDYKLQELLQRRDTAVIYAEPVGRIDNVPSITNGLTKEVEEVNSTPEYFIKCPQCQKGYQSFQSLKEHMETTHTDVNSVENTTGIIPNSVSPAPSILGPGGPYGCSQCATSFVSKDQLEKHELLHSPNAQVSCKICNKTFANVYRLQRHMISHDESAVLRKFKCTECEKAFKFKHHLKEHIRIHSGEKPFECGNCGKRFSHSGSYSSHMTSKKCLVMNLKLGRARGSPGNALLDKTSSQINRNAKRIPGNPLNNNITTSPNHNAYLPILPKYTEAAAAFLHTSLTSNHAIHPFYIPPTSLLNNSGPTISPYSIPSLNHILEQLQGASPHRPQFIEAPEDMSVSNSTESLKRDTTVSPKLTESANHFVKSNSSSCGDLVMAADVENGNTTESLIKEEYNPTEVNSNGSDLEAVKRILETVNASVTKQLLQANMQKYTIDTESDDRITSSPKINSQNDVMCTGCKQHFGNQRTLDEHECDQIDIRSEGLAAKLEDAVTIKVEDTHSGNYSCDEYDLDSERLVDKNYDYEMDCESVTTTDQVSEDGRKVRVRSLIADKQLKVLKDHYNMNPRPKREELVKIADKIGFPVRVVQVWFQNTRARDRREGRLIQVPYSPIASMPLRLPPTMVPSSSQSMVHRVAYPLVPSPQYSLEQPLDLSTKKSPSSVHSSPIGSPRRSSSSNPHSDSGEEVVNLSHKSSRSPTPFHQSYQNHYQNSNSSSDHHRSPSPMDCSSSKLARILAQPTHPLSLSNVGLVPMDGFMRLPALSQLINNRISNLSPTSEKRCWNEDNESIISQEAIHDDRIKRTKVSHIILKGLSSPGLGNPEGEIEGQFICDQCDKSFSKQSSLARHKYEHSGQRPHKCDECEKAFKHKHHLTEHKRLHSGEKPFQCIKCLKRFSHSGSYSQHMNHRYSYCKPYRE